MELLKGGPERPVRDRSNSFRRARPDVRKRRCGAIFDGFENNL